MLGVNIVRGQIQTLNSPHHLLRCMLVNVQIATIRRSASRAVVALIIRAMVCLSLFDNLDRIPVDTRCCAPKMSADPAKYEFWLQQSSSARCAQNRRTRRRFGTDAPNLAGHCCASSLCYLVWRYNHYACRVRNAKSLSTVPFGQTLPISEAGKTAKTIAVDDV
jgi:hypothetical protein